VIGAGSTASAAVVDGRGVTVRRAAAANSPPVRSAARWWVGLGLAWLVGALGAVAPTAFLGEPAAGLAACATLGLVAVAVVAPVLIAPLVASVVCDDDQHQVAAAWHAIGVSPTRRLTARAVAAAGASLRLLAIGAAAGLAAGAGLAGHGPDPLLVGFQGAPDPEGLVLGAAMLVVSWLLGSLVGAWAVTSVRAVLVLLVSLLATGSVASLLYFVPGLRPLFWATPWAALWPFDPQSFDSAQFAATVPAWVRAASGSAWLTVLAVSTVRRRRIAPYPVPGEARRRGA
jgi:hypothetical protein